MPYFTAQMKHRRGRGRPLALVAHAALNVNQSPASPCNLLRLRQIKPDQGESRLRRVWRSLPRSYEPRLRTTRNRISPVIAVPNGVWDRGESILHRSDRSKTL